MFLEVFIHLNSSTIIILNSIHIQVQVNSSPYKIISLSESCILEFWVLVHHEVVVSANRKETTCGRKLY